MAVLKFWWLLPVLVKIDANTFEVNMPNQDITKKQFSITKDCITKKLYCAIRVWKKNMSHYFMSFRLTFN